MPRPLTVPCRNCGEHLTPPRFESHRCNPDRVLAHLRHSLEKAESRASEAAAIGRAQWWRGAAVGAGVMAVLMQMHHYFNA